MDSIKVYCVDVYDYSFNTNPTQWDDDKFISEASIQKQIFGVKEFEDLLNNEEININNNIVRFIQHSK